MAKPTAQSACAGLVQQNVAAYANLEDRAEQDGSCRPNVRTLQQQMRARSADRPPPRPGDATEERRDETARAQKTASSNFALLR